MRHVDLCSGIGGFALGFEMAGLSKPILFCEIDKWCQKILRQHWRDVPILENVKDLANDPARLVPDCEILTAGYPCQPFSTAGKRKGAEDDRHLWPYIMQIVTCKRPTWCVFENVSGHISLGLDKVLSDLEAEDYAARPFVIPAAGIDAPHRRDRVWIVAHANRNSDRRTSREYEETDGEVSQGDDSGVANQSSEVCAAALGNSEHDGQLTSRDIQSIEGSQKGSKKKVKQSSRPSERTNNVGNSGCGGRSGFNGGRTGQEPTDGCSDVAYTASVSSSRRTEKQVYGVGDIQVKPRRSGENQPRLWSTEPDVGRVANGIPKRVDRIKGLGNAIVPQIAEQIGRVIKEIDDASRI